VFTVGSQTSGTWIIDSVQLEKGSTATSFDYRPYGTEQQLCFRYYEVVQAYSYAKGGQFDANGWGFVAQYIAKRVAPTVTASAAFSSPRAATTTAAIITSTAALDGAFIRLSAEL
jgi:hypothetical protein